MAEVSEREKILFFTHAKFITEGFYKTTMDEIARDLQISKKTIYKHFESKEDLLASVCDTRIEMIHKFMDDIINSDEDTITKFLRIMNKQKSVSMNCSVAWFKDLNIHAPQLAKKFDEVRSNKITSMLNSLLEQGKKEKVIENVPNDILITALNGAMEAVTRADFILNSKYSFHEAMRITSELFFNGFLTPVSREKYSVTKKVFENDIQ